MGLFNATFSAVMAARKPAGVCCMQTTGERCEAATIAAMTDHPSRLDSDCLRAPSRRWLRWGALSAALVALTGCAVVSVAGGVAGAAISVTGAVVSTGVTLTGKAVGAGIDAVTPGDAED